MDVIFIIIALIGIFSNINKKKKKQEQQRRNQEQQQAWQEGTQRPDPRFSQGAPGHQPDPRFSEYTPGAPAQQADPRFPEFVPAPQARPVRQAGLAAPRQQMSLDEGMGKDIPRAQVSVQAGNTTLKTTLGHTLEASSITGHAHTESNAEQADCPPNMPRLADMPHAAIQPQSGIPFGPNALRQAVLYSEILGKPKALRRV